MGSTDKIHVVYKITNHINNKVYIGYTSNLKYRWWKHKNIAKNKPKGKYFYIHKSINKHGVENFSIEIIEEYLSEKDAKEREIFWIAYYNSNNNKFGMNLTSGGEGVRGLSRSGEKGSFYGKKHTDATKKNMSDSRKGKCFLTKEHKERQSERSKGSKNPTAKLNKELVINIVYDYLNGNHTDAELAKKYGIGKTAISDIFRKKSWTHVTNLIPDEVFNKIDIMRKTNRTKGPGFKGDTHPLYGTTSSQETKHKIRLGHARFSIEEARKIRKEYATQNISMRKLANKYNCSHSVIENIIYNKTYKEEDYASNSTTNKAE